MAVTNSSGTLTSQQRYLPFGAPRTIPNSPILGTDFTYTGQRKLDDGMGGIMDYKARFYSPVLGRFLQPDTIIPDPANPQIWNRFTYVGNNPINHNDPDGRCYPICTAVIGAALGAIAGAVAYTIANHGQSFNATEMLVAAGAGAIAGGLIGAGVGIIAGGAATASIATAVPYLLSSGVAIATTGNDYIRENKNKFDTKDFVIQTTASGAAAAITANPSLGLGAKFAGNLAFAEGSYLLTEDNPNVVGVASVAVSTTIMSGLDATVGLASEEILYISNLNGPLKNPRLQMQQNILSTINGYLVGKITPTADRIEKQLRKTYEME